MLIGELSRETGVNVETIRYFERVGMLPKPPRTKAGRRVYDDHHLRTLAFIRRARDVGFTPAAVHAILSLGGPAQASCREVREIATHHLGRVRAKIADLATLETLLASAIDRCSDDNADRCAVIDMLEQPLARSARAGAATNQGRTIPRSVGPKASGSSSDNR